MGSYQQCSNTILPQLHILTIPDSTTDLTQFLQDCEEYLKPTVAASKLPAIISRFAELGFNTDKSAENFKTDLRNPLTDSIECLTEAIEWMRSQGVQHRSLYPRAVWLRSNQLFISAQHTFDGFYCQNEDVVASPRIKSESSALTNSG